MTSGVLVGGIPVLLAGLLPLTVGCEGGIAPAEGLLQAGEVVGEEPPVDERRCQEGPAPDNLVVPLFGQVFAGQYRTINHFDHDEPRPFEDRNGLQVDWCGRTRKSEIDGHAGYDFVMPEGTHIQSPADGEILRAGFDDPFYCPFTGGVVDDQVKVDVVHLLPDGRRVITAFKHLSQVAVLPGQRITRGQLLGLSGNTGCSTTPHLHFEVWLSPPGRQAPVLIDPFGWQGLGSDPWEAKPHGAKSIWLWRPGEAPNLLVAPPPRPGGRRPPGPG